MAPDSTKHRCATSYIISGETGTRIIAIDSGQTVLVGGEKISYICVHVRRYIQNGGGMYMEKEGKEQEERVRDISKRMTHRYEFTS
jgi:hypothetical protein